MHSLACCRFGTPHARPRPCPSTRLACAAFGSGRGRYPAPCRYCWHRSSSRSRDWRLRCRPAQLIVVRCDDAWRSAGDRMRPRCLPGVPATARRTAPRRPGLGRSLRCVGGVRAGRCELRAGSRNAAILFSGRWVYSVRPSPSPVYCGGSSPPLPTKLHSFRIPVSCELWCLKANPWPPAWTGADALQPGRLLLH